MKPITTFRCSTLLLLQSILCITLLAQTPPAKQWDKTFGGDADDFFSTITQTADGGYIMAGYSFSDISGDKTLSNLGSSDVWVAKTDANGIKQWEKRYGTSGNDRNTIIIQTKDGGYALGVATDGSGDDMSGTPHGRYDYWLIKTDASGNKQWDKVFGAYENEFFTSLQQTKDGGYILAGHSFSSIGGDKTESSRGDFDIWVIRTDATGNKLWDKTFGGSGVEAQEWVVQTSDGGFLVGAASSSVQSGDRTQQSQGGYDYWIVKTDANGNKVWDKRFGGDSDEGLTHVQQTADGGYILGGYSNSGSSGDKSQGNQGSYDYWIVKTDINGNKQWDAAFGGDGDDELWTLQQTIDGGYILGGSSNSGMNGDKSQGNQGGYDYWIVKTDANGNKQWDKRFGGDGDDFIVYYGSIQQTSDGGYVLGGHSNSGLSGDKTQESRGGNDYWIVKLAGNGCNLFVSAGANENIFFGYTPDQCVSKTAVVSGGTAPYSYSWTLDRALLSNVITNAGDETMTGSSTSIVNVCLLDTALLNVTVTDAHGCTATGSTTIYAEDVRCFAGSVGNQKVKVCHGGKTICVEENAVSAHLAHGDYLGSCSLSAVQLDGGIITIEEANPEISLAPNPSNGRLTILYNSKSAGKVQLTVFDRIGRKAYDKADQVIKGPNTYHLNLSNLASGNYYFELNNGNESHRMKFIIQR